MSGTTDIAAVRTKLEAARTRLVLDQPFIGALLLHLPFHASARCPNIATDGVRLYFNPSFIAALELRHTQFVLAHQALHCALGHFWRRGHRNRARWDLACDYAANILLVDEGLAPPPGAVLDSRYRGLSAEEIYPLLDPDDARRHACFDSHDFVGSPSVRAGSGGETPMRKPNASETTAVDMEHAASDAEQWDDAAPHAGRNGGATGLTEHTAVQDLHERWQMRVAMAAQQTIRAGRLGTSWQRLLGRILQPALPWHALLAHHVLRRARDDYSFQRPARREGQALLPRLNSAELDLFVMIDTSGSIGDEQLSAFASEIDALKSQARARVTLHACDERMAAEGPWVFEPWQPMDILHSLTGGGGTDFRPAFDWIEQERVRPDLLVYFTDAEGDFPPSPPTYPVIWLVQGAAPVPWGERIQLN